MAWIKKMQYCGYEPEYWKIYKSESLKDKQRTIVYFKCYKDKATRELEKTDNSFNLALPFVEKEVNVPGVELTYDEMYELSSASIIEDGEEKNFFADAVADI